MFLDSNNYAECCGCGACSDICPRKAITMNVVHEGFYYPVIDEELCIHCNKCRKICSFARKDECSSLDKVYYGWHKDDSIRSQSTSGGAFTAICQTLIDMYGESNVRIYGASWNESISVCHMSSVSDHEIDRIRGTKYIQSETVEIYKAIKKDLENGLTVVFSGTPCQVKQAIDFVDAVNTDRLFTVDLVCNGVASPVVFADYIKCLEKKYKSKVVSYTFRNKNHINGSQKYVRIKFESGKEIYTEHDAYYIAYTRRLLHRRSCFDCQYTCSAHPGDVTISDFWHIEDEIDKLKSERKNGISMFMANTNKGANIIHSIKCANIVNTDFRTKGEELNPSMIPSNRDIFFSKYSRATLLKDLRKYIGIKNYLVSYFPGFFRFYYGIRNFK